MDDSFQTHTDLMPDGADIVARSGALVADLRRGEREAFLRFYELYRAPVYNLVLGLTRGQADAVALTRESFISAYRQLLTRGEPSELRPLIFGAALGVCEEHLGMGDVHEPAAPAERAAPLAAGQWRQSELGERFAQALATLADRHSTALILHDVHGLRAGELAAALGVPAGTARTLLFHARESFRSAVEGLSRGSDPECRRAEQVAASAVGRLLPADEARKLREHAGYCRPCRETMASWGTAASGLSLFYRAATMPEALQTAPVFGVAVGGGLAAAASAAAPGLLARTRRALAGKAAAYAVAAACLVAATGVIGYVTQHDWRQVVVRTVVHTVVAPGQSTGQPARQTAVVTTRGSAAGSAGTSTAAGSAAGRAPAPTTATVVQVAQVAAAATEEEPAASTAEKATRSTKRGGKATNGKRDHEADDRATVEGRSDESRKGKSGASGGDKDKSRGEKAKGEEPKGEKSKGHDAEQTEKNRDA